MVDNMCSVSLCPSISGWPWITVTEDEGNLIPSNVKQNIIASTEIDDIVMMLNGSEAIFIQEALAMELSQPITNQDHNPLP